VFTPEHLAALALKVGRGKDKARVLQFIEAGKIDLKRLESIVERYELGERWREFQQQLLNK